jgi:hypothetical protein
MQRMLQTARPPGTEGQEQPGRDAPGQDVRKQRTVPQPTCRRRPWCTSATWQPACTSIVFERHSASPAGRGRANIWAGCVENTAAGRVQPSRPSPSPPLNSPDDALAAAAVERLRSPERSMHSTTRRTAESLPPAPAGPSAARLRPQQGGLEPPLGGAAAAAAAAPSPAPAARRPSAHAAADFGRIAAGAVSAGAPASVAAAPTAPWPGCPSCCAAYEPSSACTVRCTQPGRR